MTHFGTDYTSDDIMVVCMSHRVQDGEVVAQGLATPLVAAAYLLARHTHAPNLYFASAIGQSLCREPAPLSLIWVENLWLDRALTHTGFVRAAADVLPTLCPKEFFRPAQMDMYGNFNNIAFGKNYNQPRLRLPGTGGIPDVTTFISDIHLYVPRHSRLTFVPKLDFCSGLGYSSERTRGHGPRYLITDLGQFDFANGRMRLTSYHPFTTPEKIQAHTGFELEISPELIPTPEPTADELYFLSHVIDPLGIRNLESLSGTARRQLLGQIIQQELQTA
jgi:acyl CoA:acetate/3-ketoacid CoA transferase beta subunit